MSEKLCFDVQAYEIKNCVLDGRSITYRAYEGIDYCERPVDPIQKLNLFVPEAYYRGETINGYILSTAPIFAPNTVGGYMPGPADAPGRNHRGRINAVFAAIEHGYVVACAGIRGRTSGTGSKEFFEGSVVEPADESLASKSQESGKVEGYVGRAPALIVDMKAVVRYLRHNRGLVPGDVERIVTNGTSAGGALSALAGASGNSKDYLPYLESIGAASERDDIFAASCYCPIHNLEHADAAYEWLFNGCEEFHNRAFTREGGVIRETVAAGRLTEKQIGLSAELKEIFPGYVNSLGLEDEEGNALTLDEKGKGSFLEYIRRMLIQSAQKELDTHDLAGRFRALAVQGSEVEKLSCLRIEGGRITGLDWEDFVHTITRMKPVPAFDALDLSSPENEEFGNRTIFARHFTDFSLKNSEADGKMAEEEIVSMLNPLSQIKKSDAAPHWRIRHGAFDRDTSLAIPVILATVLQNGGYDVDFSLPWGLPHSGDYDLEELFAWIDGICKSN